MKKVPVKLLLFFFVASAGMFLGVFQVFGAENISGQLENQIQEIKNSISNLWVLISALLVFIMQPGFLCLESGLVRRKHSTIQAEKNILDWTITSITFFLFGFGWMFGHSFAGIIGKDFFY